MKGLALSFLQIVVHHLSLHFQRRLDMRVSRLKHGTPHYSNINTKLFKFIGYEQKLDVSHSFSTYCLINPWISTGSGFTGIPKQSLNLRVTRELLRFAWHSR